MIEIYQNEEHKRRVIERGDGYEYIGSYHCGETTMDGKKQDTYSYIRVKCPYCGREYDVILTSFVGKLKTKCTNCCNTYENSFAYYIQQELKEPLNKYWDWDKNNQLGVNPYCIYKSTAKVKIWIKCTEMDYHGSYLTSPSRFYNGNRCPYCCTRSNKVHPLDSFGSLYPEKAKYWDYKKNNKSPYEVRPRSCNGKYWFKCKTCGKSFRVSLNNLNNLNNREKDIICNNCKVSKGEIKIIKWLDNNSINYIHDKPYFKDLLSELGNPLRPDFIIEDERIWIEYDGEFHYENKLDENEFIKMQKHDKLKDKYAKEHNWKLIRIPYWEFDNIEEILEKELNKNN